MNILEQDVLLIKNLKCIKSNNRRIKEKKQEKKLKRRKPDASNRYMVKNLNA